MEGGGGAFHGFCLATCTCLLCTDGEAERQTDASKHSPLAKNSTPVLSSHVSRKFLCSTTVSLHAHRQQRGNCGSRGETKSKYTEVQQQQKQQQQQKTSLHLGIIHKPSPEVLQENALFCYCLACSLKHRARHVSVKPKQTFILQCLYSRMFAFSDF